MPVTVNPSNLTPEIAKKLSQFFEEQQQSQITSWEKDTLYAFKDGTQFKFSYDVMSRPRKAGKAGLRYEFISTFFIGEGDKTKVTEIDGTLALDPDHFHYKKEGSGGWKRALKKRTYDKLALPNCTADERFFSLSKRTMQEYERSKVAKHIAMKPPVFSKDKQTASLVMRRLKGIELFQIIEDDYDGKRTLTLNERFKLSIALLKVFQKQITDEKLVHRDLKGENIIVFLPPPEDTTSEMEVNIADFELCVAEADLDNFCCGTPAYLAPEMFIAESTKTNKVDIFSMGRILALIWKIDLRTYLYDFNKPSERAKIIKNASQIDLSSLFGFIRGLTEDQKELIRGTLKQMMAVNPQDRPSSEEALEQFEKAEALQPSSPEFSSNPMAPRKK